MDFKKLLEDLSNLTEDEFVDQYAFNDLELEEPVDDLGLDSLESDEGASTTEVLDAKTKISRALDVLKKAVEDFKFNTLPDMDLIEDCDLLLAIENIDAKLNEIENALNPSANMDRPEIEVEPEIQEEPEMDLELDGNEEIADSDEEEDKELEEVDFDAEASLDLFGTDDEE